MAIAGSQAAAIQTDRVNFAREISCSEASVQHVPMVSNVEVQTEEEALNVKDELRSELESLRAYQKETQANMTKLAASAAKAQEEAGDMCAALRERCKHLEDEKEALRVAKKISLAGPTPAPAHPNTCMLWPSSIILFHHIYHNYLCLAAEPSLANPFQVVICSSL